MKCKVGFVALAACLVALPGVVQAQFFFDDFDSYANGSMIAGQGGWQTWDGSPAWDAMVTNSQSFSPPNSLAVSGDADVVQVFAGVTSGTWYAKVQVYVPSSQLGNLYFIILNQFGATNHWSVQVRMSAGDGIVESLGGSGNPMPGTLALLTNQWVEIVAEINLDANTCAITYGGTPLASGAYQGGGVNAIAAFDLFSDGSSESYMDDVWLDTTIPVELQTFDAE